MDADTLAAEAHRHAWYHTLDLGHGVVTRGMFDHRSVVDRYLIPSDLRRMRCLDIATMDGFWAFEMERRGAEEVIALDIDDAEALDWPVSLRETDKTLDIEKGVRFELAKEALGSSVQRVLRSVYELDVDLGSFDFVFCSDLLVHLKDPITAVENIRTVCRGSATICDPVTRFRFGRRRPIAELDGIDHFRWWGLSEEALVRMMRAAGFTRVEKGKAFELPARSGGPWRGLRGVVRGYV